MKIAVSKVLALGGLCTLFAGSGHVALAQNYNHHMGDNNYGRYGQMHRYDGLGQNRHQDWQHRQVRRYQERHRLNRLHAAYAHAAADGRYRAAERDHLHAQAIRQQLRSQRRDRH